MKLSASLRLAFSLALALVLISACQRSPSTGVRLDLSPLIEQTLQSASRVDHIDLSVEAPDSAFSFNRTLSPDEADVEISVPANTPLSLIVQAKTPVEKKAREKEEVGEAEPTRLEEEVRIDEEFVTSYFGATKFVASPGTVSDVDLKVRSAGGVTVSFTFPGRLLTASARPDADTSGVRFRSTDAVPMIPDAHNERLARWESDQLTNKLILSQTLHVGTYELSGELIVDRVAYILPASERVVITHGAVLSLGDITMSCEDPNADEDRDGHPCRDDCDDSEKRCWLPHHCADSDGDHEINCMDKGFFDTGAPIPPTCGDGVVDVDAGERCDGDCPQSDADCRSDTGCTTFTFLGHAANCSARCEETKKSGCVIAGACVVPGTAAPDNSCKSCQPDKSVSAYSPAVGQACGDAACTRSKCNQAGRCEEGDPVTCASGFTCDEEAGGCACAPDTRQCANDDDGTATLLTVCEASGDDVRVTTCAFHCLSLSDTSALCLEDRQVTGLSITTSEGILVLSWAALSPQTDSLKYEIQTRNAAERWETLDTTSTTTYSPGDVVGGSSWYRVRGVEAGYPMTASSPVSSVVSQNLSMSIGSTGFLYVFATAGTYTGALGNREEANSLCSSELTGQNSAAACDRTVALVSVSDSDSIANLPALSDLPRELPLKSINGTILAHSWAELMDGTLQSSLLAADIDASTWWSGADHQGNTRDNCDGWTSRSGNASGRYGGGTATDQDWINKGSSPCDRERHVLCLCVPSSQPY